MISLMVESERAGFIEEQSLIVVAGGWEGEGEKGRGELGQWVQSYGVLLHYRVTIVKQCYIIYFKLTRREDSESSHCKEMTNI
jgi:hypothetical protein